MKVLELSEIIQGKYNLLKGEKPQDFYLYFCNSQSELIMAKTNHQKLLSWDYNNF